MVEDWLRVLEHELTRRRRICRENKDLYTKIHSSNPKGLLYQKDCVSHVWVPATHLMIHDGGPKSQKINGVSTRGFSEAACFRLNTAQIVPQMCWKCDATRERTLDMRSAETRLAEHKAARPKKQRGRKTDLAESMFDELFD